MTPLSSLFRRVKTDLADVYPDLVPLRKAVKSGSWPQVAAWFEARPPRSDLGWAARMVADMPGSEKFLQRVVDTERDSSLARSLMGTRLIEIGWEIRSGARAKYVSNAQFRIFHEYLERAERVLGEAIAIDPGDMIAWGARLSTARGLGFGLDEARRRYEKVAEQCDDPYYAQTMMVQQLAPKWGGSIAEMRRFATRCQQEAKPGALAAAVVAEAHVEQGLESGRVSGLKAHLRSPGVLEELVSAARASTLHPDFREVHGWVRAQSQFAFVFWAMDRPDLARVHFGRLGRRMSGYPWYMLAADPAKLFAQARRG